MLHILNGADEFSIGGALEEIKRQIGDAATLAMSTTSLDGKQVSADELTVVCHTIPFLSGKRLVIIGGLLERFEPRSRPQRQTSKARRGDAQEDAHKAFVSALSDLPESTVVVLIDGEVKSGNPLLKEITGKAIARTFPPVRGRALDEWVGNRVAEQGGNISPRAASSLARLVGSNLRAMAGEIDKLVLFANGRQIEEEDVRTMAGYSQQTTIFAMIDAILDFNADLAEQSLQQLLREGAAPPYILTMLARQVQLIVRAKELKSQKIPNSEMQSRLGLPNDFAFRKTLDQAGRHSLARMREVYHKLLETDLAIKTGQMDPELAVTILVAELSRSNKFEALNVRH